MTEEGMQLLPVLRTVMYTVTTAFALGDALILIPRRFGRKITLLLSIGCIAPIALLNVLCFIVFAARPEQSMLYFCFTIVKIILFQGCILLMSKHRDGRTLFAGVTASMFAMLAQTAGEITNVLTGLPLLGAAVTLLSLLGLLALCVKFIRKPYRRCFETSSQLFQWMFVVPSLYYTSLYLLDYWPRDLASNPGNILPTLVIMLLVVVSYSMDFSLLNYELDKSLNRQRQGLMEAYAKGLAAQNSDLKEYQLHGRIVRHDLRHYTTALSALLAEGHTEEAQEMLASLTDAISQAPARDVCENTIVNSILYALFHQAEMQGVTLDARLDIPQALGSLNPTDLAGVLANLMENAINAVLRLPKESRRITFTAVRQREQLMVVMRNPYVGTLKLDPETRLPLTNRGEGHGFGMRSVAAFVEQQHAVLDLQTENHVFAVRLLVRL